MIKGVGIDIVQVKRMDRWLSDLKLLHRYFHPQELEYVLLRGKNAGQSLAARFAAKEAFGKALGTGFANICLKDIALTNGQSGKPEIALFGSAKEQMQRAGADIVHVSLSHERENAVAMVVLEGV